MATPPTEKPKFTITPDSADEGPPQIFVSPTGYTTERSVNTGPGFFPNMSTKRIKVLERLDKETKKIKEANGTLGLVNDTWKPLAKVPDRGFAGLLVLKTINGKNGYGLDVTITDDENEKLIFNGNIEVEKDGIDDIFTFYIKHTNSRKTRRQRRQDGGFYPSVYGGVSGAKMLAPLIARQMLRMYEQDGYKPLATRGETKTRKRKSKKLLRNKRA
jgi:hypothetical protein